MFVEKVKSFMECLFCKEKEMKSFDDDLTNAATRRALHDLVEKYGAASALDLSAYDGMDHTGMFGGSMKRSLKSVSESKLGKTAAEAARNTRQQAGFSAEIIETTRKNKERIISGSSVRSARLDDLGRTNDQLIDTADFVLNDKGEKIIIAGTEAQMKFIGGDGSQTFDKLCESKHEKYWKSGVKVEIPKDYFESFSKTADEKISNLQNEIKTLKTNGASAKVIENKQAQLDKYKAVRRNTISSGTTSADAMLARTNPKLYTAKSMLYTAHDAGIAGAQQAAVVGGGCAIVLNMAEILKGKDIEEAIKDVAVSTGKSAARSYAISAGGSLIEGGVQHYKDSVPKLLKMKGTPTEVAGFVVDTVESFYGYFSGSISGTECMLNVAKSAAFALANLTPIGQAVFVARTAYTLASVAVGVLKQALEAPGIARERRIQIEEECKAQIALLKQFRAEFERASQRWLKETTQTIVSALNAMDDALRISDIDKYIGAANSITEAMGRNAQFYNQEEFDSLMESDEAFVL